MAGPDQHKPPGLAVWLLRLCVPQVLHEEFLGDLREVYDERVSTRHKGFARFMYWIDTLHLLLGFSSLPVFKGPYSSISMYRHYLTVAWRTLIRGKLYSLINISSLAVGIGVCLLILQYIHFEWSYDRFHPKHENIYRVLIAEPNTAVQKAVPTSSYGLGVKAVESIPGVRQYVRKNRFNRGAIVTNPAKLTMYNEGHNDLLFVDATFFEVFNFPLRRGRPEKVFEDAYSVVITQSTARKYFGTQNPIGQSLQINGPPSPGLYTVSGVVADPPVNSHLQFDFLLPMDNYIDYGWGGAVKKQGGWNGFWVITYLELEDTADPLLIEAKLNTILADHRDEGRADLIVKEVKLQAVSDVYLRSDQLSWAGFMDVTGNVKNLRVFALISCFILFIAWVNYINLSTARSMQRAREVGVRKSLGAFKRQLVAQFMVESFLVNLIAAGFALGVAYLGIPLLRSFVGKAIELSLLQTPVFWISYGVLILLGTLLSGAYPAFVLSSFNPIHILKGNRLPKSGKLRFRKSLITFQFLTSLVLIAATYLVYKQTAFMKKQTMNTDIEHILVLKSQQQNSDSVHSHFKSFGEELKRNPAIAAISSSAYTPGQFGVTAYRRPGVPASEAPYTRSIFAGQDFVRTYELELLAGRAFAPTMMADEVVIINAMACEAFGFGSPAEAIQQQLAVGKTQRTIVGVIDNFHWHSFKEAHTPYVISLGSVSMHPFISIRMDMSNLTSSLPHIQSTFQSFYPDQPFDYFFADEAFNRLYQSEVQFGNIFFFFALLAVFIACIGLFAMVSYSASLRIREIGIRKILGADTLKLMALLVKDYLVLLGIAILLSIPLVWYGGGQWLAAYAHRITLGIDLFLLPALILTGISLLTVSYRTYRSAKMNPAMAIRRE